MNKEINRISRKARRFVARHKHLQGKAKFLIESADSAGRYLKEHENVLYPNLENQSLNS